MSLRFSCCDSLVTRVVLSGRPHACLILKLNYNKLGRIISFARLCLRYDLQIFPLYLGLFIKITKHAILLNKKTRVKNTEYYANKWR
jgi:hypothetical protein